MLIAQSIELTNISVRNHFLPPIMRDDPLSHPSPMLSTSARLRAAFFLLGTANNVIYVVLLSAAVDLLAGSDTPAGLVALVNIAPALLCKLCWPLISTGRIRFARRIIGCSLAMTSGILVSLSRYDGETASNSNADGRCV